MQNNRAFHLNLIGFVALYACYGLKRFTLGVDFTDEGAYFAWPLRVALGERPFSAEVLTLLRPIEVFLFLPFKLHPEITVYEFRLVGWSLHLVAFATFAVYLFRLSRSAWLSPLLASVPFFVCHIFGLAAPSYNSLASDFLLLALSLKGLAALDRESRPWGFELAGGIALFVATVAHPGLGLIGAIFVAREIWRHQLLANIARRKLTPSNAGTIAFLAGWLALLGRLAVSGALQTWLQRLELVRTLSAKSVPGRAISLALELMLHPFVYAPAAVFVWIAATVALVAVRMHGRRRALSRAGDFAQGLLCLVIAALIYTFRVEPAVLSSAFTLGALVLVMVAMAVAAEGNPEVCDTDVRFLMIMSVLGGAVFAACTFYFSAQRSWVSGTLALPFAFGAGAAVLLTLGGRRTALFRALFAAALPITIACLAWQHYQSIQRDAPPRYLLASFRLPKLRHIESTEERVHAIESLHDYLQPKLARGQSLLVYDDCPMLYFLLDARPAYGLAWAVRYTQTPAMLRRLNDELTAQPLPEYAVRTLVDVSHARWSTAPRTNYDHYPLNETVMARYELERTIFPFEVWRLRRPTSTTAITP